MKESPWRTYTLKPEQSLSWNMGEAVLRVRCNDTELHVARQDITASGKDPLWKRWATGTGSGEVALELLPAAPDRSLIVRPEAPVHLAPGHNALFYVSIPVWLRLISGPGRKLAVCDEPSVTLSSIWHGEPTGGELCYSLRTRARRENSDLPDSQAHRAVCKVNMRNKTAQAVEFQRLCLPVRHLNIYPGTDHLWTDEVTVEYENETLNRVRITGRPAEASDEKPLGLARDTAPEGHILQRSFSALRTIFG